MSARTVMLVDDEDDILAVAKKMLENAGYNVHAFDNPLSALDHIAGGCKDCVVTISDIRMSELSGLELVRKIKQLRPGMKILLMSAFEIDLNEWRKVLPSTDADGFIGKPFRMHDLLQVVNSLI